MGCLRLDTRDYLPTIRVVGGKFFSDKTGCAGGYVYGFQGQETDDEVYGEGNLVSYKYRMHDPRLGRFFSVDPLSAKYPWNSSYAFSENRVVASVELEGLEAYDLASDQIGPWAPKHTVGNSEINLAPLNFESSGETKYSESRLDDIFKERGLPSRQEQLEKPDLNKFVEPINILYKLIGPPNKDFITPIAGLLVDGINYANSYSIDLGQIPDYLDNLKKIKGILEKERLRWEIDYKDHSNSIRISDTYGITDPGFYAECQTRVNQATKKLNKIIKDIDIVNNEIKHMSSYFWRNTPKIKLAGF